MKRRHSLPAALLALGLLLAACSGSPLLTVTAVTPTSGGAGTEVTLSGSGFEASTVVTICGAPLQGVRLTVDGRTAAAPGTVGSLPGGSTLTGTVPDLGASAECSVVLTRADGASSTWTGSFSFQGAPGQPDNQAPTALGLADLLVAGDETQRLIDLAAAFDDPDDGAAALTFTVGVSSPANNVTASITGSELALGFPSRLGDTALVMVTATDPHGASASDEFEIAFEVGGVSVTASGLPGDARHDRVASVSDLDGHVADFGWDEGISLRPGDYTFSAPDALSPGTYVGRQLRAEPVAARVTPGADDVVNFSFDYSGGSGRLWLPATTGELSSYSDDALVSGSTRPTTSTSTGSSLSAAALAPDGALWVSSHNNVARYDPSELEKPDPQPSAVLTSPGFSFIINITFDAHGNLWVADYNLSRVYMFTAALVAAAGQQSPSLTISSTAEGPLNGVAGLRFDAAGNLWVGTTNRGPNHIHRFDAADLLGASPQPSLTIASDLSNARHFSFAFDAAGDLWYTTDTIFIGHIPAASLTGSGRMTDDPRNGLRMPLTYVISLGFDPNGNLWAVARLGALMLVTADELTAAAPQIATRSLSQGYHFDSGAFVFIE